MGFRAHRREGTGRVRFFEHIPGGEGVEKDFEKTARSIRAPLLHAACSHAGRACEVITVGWHSKIYSEFSKATMTILAKAKIVALYLYRLGAGLIWRNYPYAVWERFLPPPFEWLLLCHFCLHFWIFRITDRMH
jgi:hypothetical protein